VQPGTRHALEFVGALGLSATLAYFLWPKPRPLTSAPESLFWLDDYPAESPDPSYVTIALGGGIPGNPVSLVVCDPSYDCPYSKPCGDAVATGVFDASGYFVFDWMDPPPAGEAYYLWALDTATGNWIGNNGGKGSGCFSGSDCCPAS
jgi:hypothetical protein